MQVRLEAFNPLIPGDAERSGMPVAVLRYVLHNPTEAAMTAAVCGNMPNFIGIDGSQATGRLERRRSAIGAKANRNSFRSGEGVQGIFMQAWGAGCRRRDLGHHGADHLHRRAVSYRTSWVVVRLGGRALLDFWDDFSADGMLEERDGACDTPMASLAVQVDIPAGESRDDHLSAELAFSQPRYLDAQSNRHGVRCAGPMRPR